MPRGIENQQKVLRITTKLMLPLILLFGLYVQFHGDYGPGGGFQAGVIFAAGIILYGMVFGLAAARRVVPVRLLAVLMPFGVLLYAGVGVASLVLGGEFLNYNALSPEHPVHGQHLGILLVELGVGISVAAVMISIFLSFAGRGHRT